MTSVLFSRIPHQTQLFLDYANLSPKALAFYERPPVFGSLESAARRSVGGLAAPRGSVAAILKRQNEAYGCSAKTLELIRSFQEPDCVAVVTGQQVGLFTGPLYTIYKALTAISLADQLRERGIRAVPLFWMDSEDHDIAEVTRTWILGFNSALEMTDFSRLLFEQRQDEEAARSVGSIIFPDSILTAVENYSNALPDSPWREQVQAQLRAVYRPGSTFTLAFGRRMSELFSSHGLILFDPQDPEAKELVSAVFQKAVDNAAVIYETLTRRNEALLASGYHNQVHIQENSTVLFVHNERERRALTRFNGDFALKSCDKQFSARDLMQLAQKSPERFSPNVLLRPIVQDSLFPTVAYVAGPAEIAYFAQIQALYPLFERWMPAIWPRASFTLIEPEISENLQRFGLAFEDCLQGKHHLVEKMIASTNHSSSSAILKGLQAYLEQALDELRPDVVSTDASLGPALDTAKRKILHHVEGLQTKFVHLEARHNRTLLEQAGIILNHCYPNKTLQERTLGIHYFLARHGPSLLDTLHSRIQIASFDHKLLKLD